MKKQSLKKYKKWLDNNFVDIKDKTVAVTGSTGAIGTFIVEYLLHLKANVILIGRNAESLSNLKNILEEKYNTKIKYLIIDYDNINSLYKGINDLKVSKIDYLINNAGIYHQKYKIINGFERTFYVNYLLPMYLTFNLLKDNKDLKVINVSSISYHYKKVDFDDFDNKTTKDMTLRYAQSKKELILFSIYLKELGYKVNLAHPGISCTNLFSAKNGGYNKAFYKLIVPIMRKIFISPAKAALPIVKSLDEDFKIDEWQGPSKFFHSYGYPKVYKLSKQLFKKNMISKNAELTLKLFEYLDKNKQ